MATSVITNDNLDTKAALVAAPIGPLTRVGSAAPLSPNSHVSVEFTSALGVTVFLSYDDFVDGMADRMLEDAHAVAGFNVSTWLKIRRLMEFIYRWMVSNDPTAPYRNANLQSVFKFLATNPDMVALTPNYSDKPADRIELAFTLADAGSNVCAVTNTTTGDYEYIMWDYGNSVYKFTSTGNPSNTDYGSTGAKTVTAIAVGRGGITSLAKSVTLA